MHRNFKLTEAPDAVDIRTEGRRSGVGNLHRRGSHKNKAAKAAVRRSLKRADKGRFRLESEI